MLPRQLISSGSPFERTIGFSRAVRIGDRVCVSGTGPVFPDGRCPIDAAEQARRCFDIIETALVAAGAAMTNVIRTRMYITNVADADAVGRVHGAVFGVTRPAATMVVIAALLDPRWRVEIEAEAVAARADVARASQRAGVGATGTTRVGTRNSLIAYG